jgi:hypothetical protein
MLWLKRNLIFALSLVVAVGLFLFGSYYLFSKWSENSEVQKQLEETDASLKKIYDLKSTSPTATNIMILRQQDAELKTFLTNVMAARKPLDFDAKISSANFKTLLDNSLAQLNRQADQARIPVAQKEFGFSNIKPLVSFAEGSVPLLAEQLAEVKLICGILFRSEISALENLRRQAISKDDLAAVSSVDYHAIPKMTNDLTGEISSFHVVTFTAFSESLASVLENVERSPEALSVRLLSVLPAAPGKPGAGPAVSGPVVPVNTGAPAGAAQRGQPRPGGPGAAAANQTRRLETLADEKAFRVSMLLEVTKAAPPAE